MVLNDNTAEISDQINDQSELSADDTLILDTENHNELTTN